MGALLAIATFALFILIDYLLSRRASEREAHATETAIAPAGVGAAAVIPEAEFVPEPVWVAGYELPEHLHYHRGHIWARVVSPGHGRRRPGRFLPPPDRQGRRHRAARGRAPTSAREERARRSRSKNRAADLIAPVEGRSSRSTRRSTASPRSATDDPYGRGWLFKIRSTNLAAALRNLLSGSLARRWVEDSREQLDMRLMATLRLRPPGRWRPRARLRRARRDTEEWQGLVEKFLLTQGYERSDVLTGALQPTRNGGDSQMKTRKQANSGPSSST